MSSEQFYEHMPNKIVLCYITLYDHKTNDKTWEYL